MHYELKCEKKLCNFGGKNTGAFFTGLKLTLKNFKALGPMVYFRILPRTAHSATENSYDQALVLQLK